MTLVLDSGGVSALAGRRARLEELRRRNLWPPVVPAVVLTEALTGDHRRDHAANQVLRLCIVRPVDEPTARDAARLRTGTGRPAEVSAVDAIVAAVAIASPDPIVLTSDPVDLSSLVQVSNVSVRIART